MPESEIILPGGCSVEPPNRFLGGLGRLFRAHHQFENETLWNQKWAAREDDAKKIFKMAANFTLFGDFEDQAELDLDKIEGETGLTYWKLLEEGMRDFHDQTLVVTTTNRTQLPMENELFAVGNAFELVIQNEVPAVGKRIARIPMIGIVLNTSAPTPTFIPNAREVPGSYIINSLNALLNARIAYYRELREGRLGDFFNQRDLDAALDWVLFDKQPPRGLQ